MGRFTNSLGYTPEEQQRMHQEALDAYDAAVRKKKLEEQQRMQQESLDDYNLDIRKKELLNNTFNKTPVGKLYSAGQSLGEFGADAQIAYQEKKRMDDNARQLVNQYGSGAAKDIDNYHHALLQCHLAKISPESRQNGKTMGWAKEYFWDYPKKSNSIVGNLSREELLADINKDLNNNDYGSGMVDNNPSRSCVDSLEHMRTPNMRRSRMF